jgi:hypothetical protein
MGRREVKGNYEALYIKIAAFLESRGNVDPLVYQPETEVFESPKIKISSM